MTHAIYLESAEAIQLLCVIKRLKFKLLFTENCIWSVAAMANFELDLYSESVDLILKIVFHKMDGFSSQFKLIDSFELELFSESDDSIQKLICLQFGLQTNHWKVPLIRWFYSEKKKMFANWTDPVQV